MATNQYYGSIPGIAKAFENDPRSKLAASALAQGTSTAPVAGGGWGVTDGLARAAQAILGAVVNKSQEKKYAKREGDYTSGIAEAAKLASTPQPTNPAQLAPQPQGYAQAAQALAGGQGPIQTVDPNTALGAPPGAPPASMTAPPAPMAPPGASQPMGAPSGGLVEGGRIPGATEYYRRGIRPIEGGTDPKTGAFRISSKGAVGPGQIMPSTGPEAARLAGVPWDERRFRSDTAYNDALGQAYFAKKLEEFNGDPLKAAAAYNGGAGATRRAIRKATRAGDPENWVNFFPPKNTETPEYVQKFKRSITQGYDQGQSVSGVSTSTPTQVAAPAMEAVPEGPAQMSAGAVASPDLPPEVQTNRIAMAQQLLQSGNPDLAAMAQTYLDKGLDEQNSARTKSSDQQFQRGQSQFEGDIQMRNTGVAADRNNMYEDRRGAQARNATREGRFSDQTFTAGENAADRNFRGNESSLERNFRGSESHLDRTASRENLEYSESNANARNAATIEGRKQTRTDKQNVYYNTPTGLKMQDANNKLVTSNEDTINKLTRYIGLNENVDTGGIAGTLPGRGLFDKQYAEMQSLANETTLGKIGGSLGTAISDGDRKFIETANVNARNPKQANRNIAQATINTLKRSSERALAFGDAQAEGKSARAFAREWSRYIQEVSVARTDKNGNVSPDYVPFDVWQEAKAGNLRRVP